jgi:transcriptional regulator with XRE-family HTH domain
MPMPEQTLGDFIRELREKADYSLREFAKEIEVSPAFQSDVEMGRRYPSDETFDKISKKLKVSVEELKRHDIRESVADLKRLVERNPTLGFAFRTAVDDFKKGKLTAEELARRLKGK